MNNFPDERTSRVSLSNCIVKIGDRFLDKGEVISIHLSSTEASKNSTSATVLDRILLFELFQKNHWSVTISNGSAVWSKDFKRTDNYIIHIRGIDEVGDTLQALQTTKSWNSHAKFFIISATIYKKPEEVVTYIMKYLWLAKVVNAIVVLVNPKNTTVQHIYTWYPFANGNCGNYFDKAVLIDKCAFGRFERNVDLFAGKIPSKLNNCTVRVRVVVWPPFIMPPSARRGDTDLYEFNSGLEIELMNTIAEKANFEVLYTMSPRQGWGEVSTNGTMTGVFLHLFKKRTDIVMGSIALTNQRMEYFDTSTSYIRDSLVWCVPHAQNQPPFQKLSNSMKLDTWCLIIFAYVMFSLTIWSVSSFQNTEGNSYKSLPNVLQNALSILLGMAVKVQPRTSIVRIFLWFWIMTSLVLDITYTTHLISVLTSSKYDTQIQTLSEIFNNNLKILLMPNSLKYFNGSSWKMQKLMNEFLPCDNMDKCLHRVAFHRDSAVCVPQLYLEYVFHKYINSNNEPLLYCFHDSVVDYPITMLMTRGYPLKGRIDTLIQWSIAAGFIVLWENRIFGNSWGGSNADDDDDDDDDTEWMTLTHLYPIFITLAVGHTFALLAFLAEIYSSSKFSIMRKVKRI